LAPLALCGRDGPLAVRGGGEGCLAGVPPCVAGMGLGTLSEAHARPASVGGGGVDDGQDCAAGAGASDGDDDGLSSSECAAGGSRWGGCLWGGRTRWPCGAAGEPRDVASCARGRVTHTHRTWPVSPTRGVRAGTAAAASLRGTCIPRGAASGTWGCSPQHIGLQPPAHRVAAAST